MCGSSKLNSIMPYPLCGGGAKNRRTLEFNRRPHHDVVMKLKEMVYDRLPRPLKPLAKQSYQGIVSYGKASDEK